MQKICFAASSGGHFEEILRLGALKDGRDCFLFTEKSDFLTSEFCDKVYYVNQINRKEFLFIFKFIILIAESLKVLLREKPDCVITTGALAAVPISVLAKWMGKKLIYIESFARVDTSSMSGKILYPIADLFIVQWENSIEFFPKAVYTGWIF